jgi:hypothetical protein
MDFTSLLKKLKPKSPEEILTRIGDLIQRHRRRYLKRNLRPCPLNCDLAKEVGRTVVGCVGCSSRNPEVCNQPDNFVPLYTKAELYEQFQEEIQDYEVLVRNYRDLAMLLWVVGVDSDETTVIQTIEDAKEK